MSPTNPIPEYKQYLSPPSTVPLNRYRYTEILLTKGYTATSLRTKESYGRCAVNLAIG